LKAGLVGSRQFDPYSMRIFRDLSANSEFASCVKFERTSQDRRPARESLPHDRAGFDSTPISRQ
jgi:hypothetical protein